MTRLAVAVLICLSPSVLAQEFPPPNPAAPPPQFENPYTPPPPPVEAVSTRAGAFGIKAGFGASVVPVSPAGGPVSGAAAPAFGLKWLASERLALNLDFGLALGFGSILAGSVSVGTALDVYLGALASPLRPFVTFGLGLSKPLSIFTNDWSAVLSAGVGAEHWFTDHFSLNARLLVVLPVDLNGRTYSVVSTFVPAMGAVFYF